MATTQQITTLNSALATAVQTVVGKEKSDADTIAALTAENAKLTAQVSDLQTQLAGKLDDAVLDDFINNVTNAVNALNPA